MQAGHRGPAQKYPPPGLRPGTVLGTVDVGRTFGDRQQYGLRINAAGGSLGTPLRGVDDGSRRF